MRGVALVVATVAFVGCGESASEAEPEVADAGVEPADAAPEPDAAPDPDAAPEPDAAPPVDTPAVWGPAPAEGNPAFVGDTVEVNLVAAPHTWPLVDGAMVPGYAYNAQVPGPTIQAHVGDEIVVNFTNQLDEPTTIHWHGLRISDEMDGNPRIQDPVQPGETFTYRFPAREAGTFWYHPHVRSNEQVEKGLYGALIIHEAEAPAVPERVILLDDILFVDGQMPAFLNTHPEVMHGRFGNILLTNGQATAPKVSVAQGTTERWRVTNTANARTMEIGVQGARWRVVGVDGGLLPEPYTSRALTVAVGQRYDLEVRFDEPGEARLVSRVLTQGGPITVPLMEVTVDATGDAARWSDWTLPEPLPFRQTTDRLTLTFEPVPDPVTEVRWQINGRSDWGDEAVFTAAEGAVVEITLDNRGGPEHPFHLHGQFFEVVSDGRAITDQPGLKDTVLVPGQTSLDIVAYLDNPGRWMAHCHILGHAELGMMSTFVVTPQ